MVKWRSEARDGIKRGGTIAMPKTVLGVSSFCTVV